MNVVDSTDLKKVLGEHEEISFAYMHGSYLTSESPRDVDIAVFLNEERYQRLSEAGEVNIGFAIPLEMEFEKRLRIKADVQVLNRAPLTFRHRVVQKGVLIVDHEVDLRCQFEYQSRFQYFDFQPRRMMYLQEVFA
jgi:uncharacterized protein